MDKAALKRDACDAIDAMRGDLLAVSHKIHETPELAFEETRASALLAKKTESAGLDVKRGVFGLETAYAASFGKGKTEIGIISEYDALPGIGHACGHNIIATAGLGAALALAKLGSALPGRVRYLGTPAEERGGGKEIMARAGAFDKLTAAMMVHPAGFDILDMPSLCVNDVRVLYEGRTAHASAMPHAGINALDALVTAYQAIAQLRQHIRPSERIHGIITEGGQAPNIVPDRAAAFFYIRAANAKALGALTKRVAACFNAGAQAAGATCTLDWGDVSYLDVKANMPLSSACGRNMEAFKRKPLPPDALPAGAAISTDMGNVSHRVPSIHPMIAAAPPRIVIHNPEFARHAASPKGDDAAIDGAKILAMTALDVMIDAELRTKIAQDFKATAQISRDALKALKAKKPAGCC